MHCGTLRKILVTRELGNIGISEDYRGVSQEEGLVSESRRRVSR